MSAIRIIYGVSGEGSGHAIRSREVLRYLCQQGCEVRVVTCGRARALLESEFETITVFGLQLDYRRNAVRYLPSIWRNLVRAPAAMESLNLVLDLINFFQPHIVCTDFEPLIAAAGGRMGLPVVSIDNIHRVQFSSHRTPWRYRHEYLVAKAVINLIIPRADRYVVTTLSPELFNNSLALSVPPIVRSAVLSAKPISKEHILVYDSFADKRLPQILNCAAQSFFLYGHDLNVQQGNVRFKTFSEKSFLEDLISCRAVIGTGGFTLISESLALHKPYLALPAAGQFEQTANGLEIEQLGYGKMLRHPSVDDIQAFIAQINDYSNKLESYHYPENNEALEVIYGIVRNLAVRKVIH